jgi:hypothetical protein
VILEDDILTSECGVPHADVTGYAWAHVRIQSLMVAEPGAAFA